MTAVYNTRHSFSAETEPEVLYGSHAGFLWTYFPVTVLDQQTSTFLPCATAGRLGTEQAMGSHRAAGRQCTDAIEAGVSTDEPACILHTGTGNGGIRQEKGRDGAAYVVPDWAGRTGRTNYMLHAAKGHALELGGCPVQTID